ncbi:MAG TPA: hypothetical protein VF912_02985 [Anaeromyxobacter sp.]
MPARTLGLMLSLWLFFSAFAWHRSKEGFANAWLVGLFTAVASVAGMRSPRARFVATALSIWLVVAAFVLPRASPVAFWNDVAVGALMFLLSLVPGTLYLPAEHLQRRAHA